MTIKKPKLSLDEQIEHLKDKGILFNIMDESDAKKYLTKIIIILSSQRTEKTITNIQMGRIKENI